MRYILFRAKRKDNEEWIEGFYVRLFEKENGFYKAKHYIFDGNTKLGEERYCGHGNYEQDVQICKYEVIPETVGQYTGLTDKNGKKIFEGDILFVTVREYTKECGIRKFTGNTVKTVWSVEYAERRTQGNGFFVFGKDRRFSVGLTKSVIYNASPEIIGNIHDNPELLKGGGQE